MRTKDAISLLAVQPPVTWECIKLAYRRAMKKYHPDRNPAGLQMTQVINEAFVFLEQLNNEGLLDSFVERCAETEAAKEQNFGEILNAALNAIIHLPGLVIEVCGCWIWISGETRKYKDQLKAAGFKWAPKKMQWYFRPEDWKSKNKGKFSMEEIRSKYGSSRVENEELQELAA